MTTERKSIVLSFINASPERLDQRLQTRLFTAKMSPCEWKFFVH